MKHVVQSPKHKYRIDLESSISTFNIDRYLKYMCKIQTIAKKFLKHVWKYSRSQVYN